MSKARISVAVVGATGAVGEALLTVLEERAFPVEKLSALARAEGEEPTAMFADRPVLVTALEEFDFSHCDVAFFCVPAAVAKKYAPKALAVGCHVIDVSAQFRLNAEVPLLIADFDNADSDDSERARLLSSPSAQALQIASVLQPLAKAVGIKSIDVTTLTAVSALGRPGVNELASQSARLLNAQSIQSSLFPAQIAFNVVPAFDAVQDNGYTLEELNIAAEINKILAAQLGIDQPIPINITQVYVPVFYCHSQVVRVETLAPLSAAAAGKLLAAAPGVQMAKAKKQFGPIDAGVDGTSIKVGRIRQAPGSDRILTLWTVADNIRKGAAVNSVRLAETLLKPDL